MSELFRYSNNSEKDFYFLFEIPFIKPDKSDNGIHYLHFNKELPIRNNKKVIPIRKIKIHIPQNMIINRNDVRYEISIDSIQKENLNLKIKYKKNYDLTIDLKKDISKLVLQRVLGISDFKYNNYSETESDSESESEYTEGRYSNNYYDDDGDYGQFENEYDDDDNFSY